VWPRDELSTQLDGKLASRGAGIASCGKEMYVNGRCGNSSVNFLQADR
jgi:hypothetical protein